MAPLGDMVPRLPIYRTVDRESGDQTQIGPTGPWTDSLLLLGSVLYLRKAPASVAGAAAEVTDPA